jgi:hypothetical protein
MKNEQWVKNRLKKVESEVQENKKTPWVKPKKYERIYSLDHVFNALLYGVVMGKRDAYREVLEMPKIEVKGVQ